MLAFPRAGFVLLAVPKSGTTALDRALSKRASLVAAGPPPSLKHLTAAEFERSFAPILADHGHPRDSYETVAMVREPVSWLVSWWRYRSRDKIAGRAGFVGDLSFAEFVDRVAAGGTDLRPQLSWLTDDGTPTGRVVVDRLFRYEDFDAAVAWMAERFGSPIEIPRVHASPGRDPRLTDDLRARAAACFPDDVALHASLVPAS